MLKYSDYGIEYNGKLYIMGKRDREWIDEQNKKYPSWHPARNLKDIASIVVDVDDAVDEAQENKEEIAQDIAFQYNGLVIERDIGNNVVDFEILLKDLGVKVQVRSY